MALCTLAVVLGDCALTFGFVFTLIGVAGFGLIGSAFAGTGAFVGFGFNGFDTDLVSVFLVVMVKILMHLSGYGNL